MTSTILVDAHAHVWLKGMPKIPHAKYALDYDFTPQWTGKFEANYSRLAGDAADSPLVQKIGSRNQITVGFGLAYRFGVDYR